MKHFPAVILALLTLVLTKACIYPFELDYSGTELPLIIEGSIMIGDVTRVKVSRVKNGEPETTDPFRPIKGIDFTAAVEGEDGIKVEESGWNYCDLDTRSLPANQRYRLLIHIHETGEDYASEWTSVEEKPVLDNSYYRINEDTETIDFLFSMHGDGNTPYYSIAYNETYEYNSLATTTLRWDAGRVVDVGVPYDYRTCWMSKAQDVKEVVSTGAMKDNHLKDYPVRHISRYDRAISVRYHLKITASFISQEAYKYWDNLDKISYDGGDLFRPIPSDVRGNIYNVKKPEEWVIGYISASEVAIADVCYNNIKEKFYRTSMTDRVAVESSQLSDAAVDSWRLVSMKYVPYRGIYGVNEAVPDYYMWIKSSCTDCRSLGGNLWKPEGWEDLFND